MASAEVVRLERNMKKTACMDTRYLGGDELHRVLNSVRDSENHIMFVDDVSNDAETFISSCKKWHEKDRVKRRLVVVTSMSYRRTTTTDGGAEMDFVMSPWTLGEYLQAVEDDELFQRVKPKLDVFDGNGVANSGAIEAFNQSTCADSARFFRQKLVQSKYYFAGGSARRMFSMSTARMIDYLGIILRTLGDQQFTAALLNDDDFFVRSFRDQLHTGTISRYVGSVIVMSAQVALTPALGSIFEAEDYAATMEEWKTEMYFFACVRKGILALYDGEVEIRWPKSKVRVVDLRKLSELPAIGWLKPQQFDQGGYDVVHIDQEHGLVHFVQVARAHNHEFHVQCFHRFLCLLRDSVSSFEVTRLEIFIVVEREALSDFEFSKVTGEGLLAAFLGWEEGGEADNARRVEIQAPKDWSKFNW